MYADARLREYARTHPHTVRALAASHAQSPARTADDHVAEHICAQFALAAHALEHGQLPNPQGCALLSIAATAEAAIARRRGGKHLDDFTQLVELSHLLERAALVRVPLTLEQRAELIALDATDPRADTHRDTIQRLVGDELVHGFDALRFALTYRQADGPARFIAATVLDALSGDVQNADTVPIRIINSRVAHHTRPRF